MGRDGAIDDDAEYYRQEVGEEPDEGVFKPKIVNTAAVAAAAASVAAATTTAAAATAGKGRKLDSKGKDEVFIILIIPLLCMHVYDNDMLMREIGNHKASSNRQ